MKLISFKKPSQLIHGPFNSISYFHGVSSKPLIYSTVGSQLERTSHKFSSNLAIISQHQRKVFTYEEVFQNATTIAASFLALGLKKHDRIGIYSPNCYQWYLIQMAASLANLILVNLNPAYQTNELEYALNKVECKALVMASGFKYSNYIEILGEIAPEIAVSKAGNLNSKRLPNLKILIKIDEKKTNGFFNFSDLKEISDTSHFLELNKLKISPDDPTNIQFTSGTTGKPKGATLSHMNLINNGYFIGERLNYTHQDRICIAVPLYHCFGMVLGNLGAMTRGACVVYPSEGFEAKETLKALTKFNCSSIYGVPTMFLECLNELEKNKKKHDLTSQTIRKNASKLKKLTNSYDEMFDKDSDFYDLSSLKKGIVAGSVCSKILMERVMNEMNLSELTNAYGMTETSPANHQTSPTDPFEKKINTVGKALQHIEAKIIDEKGNTVAFNTPGEICVRGYNVMLKYWNDQEETRKTIDHAGWLHSGDLGIMDAEGFVSIIGRIKDLIIRGGENVYPKELEDFLLEMDNVLDVQVFGVHDEKFGEEICAYIRLKNKEKKFRKESVAEFCKKKIAHNKVPKYVRIVEEFPATITGKTQKFKMRDEMNSLLKDPTKVLEFKTK